jgi:predicted metal-dependent phosphoesterase TrpH
MLPAKELFMKIKRRKPLKADLHLHTAEDPLDDVRYTGKDLISKAADDGFDVIAITNHHRTTFNEELLSHAREKGILLIPGVELTIQRRHVLVLNPPGQVKCLDFPSLSKLRRSETLIITPHPYFPGTYSLNGYLLQHIGLFDALEYCHFYSQTINFNLKAEAVSDYFGLPLIGNSDAHFLSQLGSTYSLIYAEKNLESVFAAIRQKKLKIVSRLPIPVISATGSDLFRPLVPVYSGRQFRGIPATPSERSDAGVEIFLTERSGRVKL